MSRPNIADLFSKSGTSSLKNSKQLRLLQNLQWRQSYQHSETYIYSFDNQEANINIELQQIPNGELKGLGTGTFIWPAAQVLAKYFEKRFCDNGLKGKVVCDIGSGAGLTGFVSAYLGATVILTDQDCILPLLKANLQKFESNFKNYLHEDQLKICEYEWTSKQPPTSDVIDIVIVSDCVLPKLYPIDILIEAVDVLIGDNTIAFFSYEHRPYPQFDPRQEFQRLCALKGLTVSLIPLSSHHQSYCADDIELWEVRRQREGADGDEAPQEGLVITTWDESSQEIPLILQGIPITLHQASKQGIGGALWPSSIIVSRFILKELTTQLQTIMPNIAQHQKSIVLDLGAGCGLTSMALHAIGYNVITTDKPSLLPILQDNIEKYLTAAASNNKNQNQKNNHSLSVQPLDWEDEQTFLTTLSPALIVCSDCLYNSATVYPLLNVLEKHIPNSATVLLVNEMRTALEEFLYLARRSLTHDITIQEIEINQPSLEIVRNAKQIKFSPPLRMCFMKWQKKITA